MFSYLSPVQKGPPVTGWSLLLVAYFDVLFILRIIFSGDDYSTDTDYSGDDYSTDTDYSGGDSDTDYNDYTDGEDDSENE